MVKVKNRKKNLVETAAKKRDQQRKKTLNPFEIHINKEKQKVLGRKNKADRGLPGTARTKAINKRKGTLLQEYKIKDKDNVFLDRRLGERNLTMTQEEKAMARFTAERMKAHRRKNIFNLNDDEVLTHRGQTLAEIEKFDDPRSDDDDEFSDEEREAGKLNKKFVGEAHFGGGILSKPNTPMSRKDLIEQLIAESKKRKAEKQKVREETIDLTEKLDSGWKDLLPIVAASKNTSEQRDEKLKVDDYDITLRELKFEARGTPCDRLKSEEEVAAAEKERLEALEADRLARMKGSLDSPRTCVKHKSADDLDDGFVMENVDEDTLTNGEDNLGLGVQESDNIEDDSLKTGSSDSGDGDVNERNVNDEYKKRQSKTVKEETFGSSFKNSSDNARDKDDLANNEKDVTSFGDDVAVTEDKSINRLKGNSMEEQSKSMDDRKQDASFNIEIGKKETKLSTRNIKIIEKKESFDNIPVLKISDQTNVVERKNVLSNRIVTNGNANKTKCIRERDIVGSREVTLQEESETDSQSKENSEDEDSSEEDNLSDLKASESSSEDDELTGTEDATFSDNCMQSKSMVSAKSDKFQLRSIVKVAQGKEEKIQTSTDEKKTEEISSAVADKKKIMEQIQKELPYTYKMPENLEQLQELLRDRNPYYQSVIVERIVKCNHQSLDEGNKEKLANLFAYLLQHLNDCATNNSIDGTIKCFQIFDRLCPHLYDLAHVNPVNAKVCLQKMIKEKYEKFERNKKRYPGLDTLILFKLVSLLFPTSDFRHPIVTPVLTFMTEILQRCRVKSRTAISKGLFVSTLILEVNKFVNYLYTEIILNGVYPITYDLSLNLQYTLLSKRFAPSVVNFLRGLIYMATPKPSIQIIKTVPPFKSVGESSNLLIVNENQAELIIDLKGAHMSTSDLVEEELDDNFKLRAFLTAINLLLEFKGQLELLEAAYSIVQPIIKLLRMNSLDKCPKTVRKHVKSVYKDLKSLKDKRLEYIVLEKKRPKPLRLYEPRIEVVYDGRRHKPMSKKKAEKEKLLHKYKRELKSAVREVRKDRAFLAKVKIKQQLKSDEERKRKVKEIFGDAAIQQSELNRIKRKKGD